MSDRLSISQRRPVACGASSTAALVNAAHDDHLASFVQGAPRCRLAVVAHRSRLRVAARIGGIAVLLAACSPTNRDYSSDTDGDAGKSAVSQSSGGGTSVGGGSSLGGARSEKWSSAKAEEHARGGSSASSSAGANGGASSTEGSTANGGTTSRPGEGTSAGASASGATSVGGSAAQGGTSSSSAAQPECRYSSRGTDGSCAPVCGSSFVLDGPLQPGAVASTDVISVTGYGEDVLGIDAQDRILYLASIASASACGWNHLRLAVPSAGKRSFVEVSGSDLPSITRTGWPPYEARLTADGQLIAANKEGTGFVMGPLASNGVLGTLSGAVFAEINAFLALNKWTAFSPAMSGDGRVFTFNCNDGIYEARRPLGTGVFPAAQISKVTGDLPVKFAVITSLSWDGLTAFASEYTGYTTGIFSRTSINDVFASATSDVLKAWNLQISADCRSFVSTVSPGGCPNQDIATGRAVKP